MTPKPSSPTKTTKPEFSEQAVREGYWEIYHDDDCGVTLIDGFCPACNFSPDLQSKGARRTKKSSEPISKPSCKEANPPTMSRSMQKRIASLKGEPYPTFEPAPSGETRGTCRALPYDDHPTNVPHAKTKTCLYWKPVAPEATSYSHDIGGCCGYVIDWHGNDPVLCFLKPGHEEKEHMGQLILRKVAPEAAGTKKHTLSCRLRCAWDGADGCTCDRKDKPDGNLVASGEAVGLETRDELAQAIIRELNADVGVLRGDCIRLNSELSILRREREQIIAKVHEARHDELVALRERDQAKSQVRELTANREEIKHWAETCEEKIRELRATIERLREAMQEHDDNQECGKHFERELADLRKEKQSKK